MAETLNYGLYVEDNDQTKFIEWREKVAGKTGSNMVKIDAALKAHDDAMAGKQAALVDGDGTTVSGNAVDLDTPTRGILTQAEYDALPEEQKVKGLYVISDSGDGPVYATADELDAAVAEINAAKQDKLTGTTGQVVGFDAEGKAVAQEAPQTGLSQEEADGRYLKLSGGEVNDGFSAYAFSPDAAFGQLVAAIELKDGTVNLTAMDEPGSSNSGLALSRTGFYLTVDTRTVISVPNRGGGVQIKWLAAPTEDTMPATKKYVDDAVAGVKAAAWKPFHVGSSAPTDTTQLWIDTTAGTGGLKYHNGSAWVHVPVAYT